MVPPVSAQVFFFFFISLFFFFFFFIFLFSLLSLEIHQACLYGHPDAVNFLLKHGALVHQADNFGNNALSNAIRGRFIYIYRIYIHNYFLLKHGALVHQADNFGNNALSNAIRGRFIYI